MRSRVAVVWLVAACGTPPPVTPDAGAPGVVTITAEVTSTRFVTREHMLAAAEMQISGEPFAEAMGRDLKAFSRVHLPTDIYFAQTGAVVDVPGFSTAIESYEYSKQPMNELAFESGAGTSLTAGPLANVTPAAIQHFAAGANTLGRFVFAPGTFPANNPSGTVNPNGTGTGAENPLGWPGLWPTNHVFASFDPAIAPTSAAALECGITSDDDPGKGGTLGCADYECDATTLHLPDRAAQIESTITPGADGFSGWKYGLWTINYLQVLHDANEAPVTTNGPGIYLGSSDIEGFQAQLFIAMLDNRAEDWLLHLSTADGATLTGFASIADALAYTYASPLRWFPARIAVTETPGGDFPEPSYALASSDSSLLDAAGMVLAYSEAYALTDADNATVGGSQPVLAIFDGDPFPADNGLADGEATLHDRALAMLRVAIIDLDRMHGDPATGILVDDVTAGARGSIATTTTVAYTLLALRTASRALTSQLELYSNNVPDTAAGATPLDALALDFPGDATLTFGARVKQLVVRESALLYDHLTDATGHAWRGWDLAAAAPIADGDELDAYTAAIRGLFAAYLATGDTRFRDRAVAVYDRMDAVFYDPVARIYGATPAPVALVEYTPLRFALLQSALRDVYELVAARPGSEALATLLEQRVGRLNKLVLDGWDDRNDDGLVGWPFECATVDAGYVPHGGLQMAERTLTGETGSLEETVMPGQARTRTFDRDWDCVPEIDDAHLPAALADAITFRIARP